MEVELLQLVQSFSHPLLEQFFLFITFFGNPIIWILFAAAIYWSGRDKESLYLTNLVLFSSAIVGILKGIVASPRPSAEKFNVIAEDFYSPYSFPSGHSSLIAAVYAFYSEKLKPNMKIIFVLLVLLVAYSRLYLGVHFPLDVIVGLMLGYLIGKGNLWLVAKLKKTHFKISKLGDELIVIILIAIGMVAVLFFSNITLLAGLLGYYAGFFYAKEISLPNPAPSKKELIPKIILGFAGIGAFAAAMEFGPFVFEAWKEFIIYFIVGFYISFIFPLVYNGVIRRSKK
ncbi:MAG: phosphatase PAP2 family protein [Candidatus Diapherotrites archaeon]